MTKLNYLKKLLFIFVIIQMSNTVFGKTYYVSTFGSDENSGTIAFPYRTIQFANTKITDSDTLFIREGTYHIPSTIKLKSNITLLAYKYEKVEIHGTELKKEWYLVSKNVWKTAQKDSVIQLFIDGKPYFQASYPEISEGINALKQGAFAVAYPNKEVYVEGLNQFSNLKGTRILGLHGKGLVSLNGLIKEQSSNVVSIENDAFYWGEMYRKEYLDTGKAFIVGSKQFMDKEREWYWENGELFMISNEDPNTLTIECRTSNYILDLSNCTNNTVSNISFVGSNLDLSNTTNCRLFYCNFKYITAFFYFPDGFERYKYLVDKNNNIYFDPPEKWTGKGITISGSNNSVENCYIAHSWGDGLTVWGNNHTIKNNEIYDCDWVANDCAPLSITGSSHLIEYNTIHQSARSIIVHRKIEKSKIKNNHLFKAGILCEDLGITYCYDTDGKNTEISYNYMHDNNVKQNGSGLYLDNGNANFIIHHNIISNSLVGINMNKSTSNNKVYQNTLYNNTYSMGCWGPEGSELKNTYTFNNLTNTNKKTKWNYDAFYGTQQDSNHVYFDNNIFVDPANHNFQLRKNSYPIDRGIKNEYTIDYKGAAPDMGALESGLPPWKYGSSLIIPNEKYYPPKAPLHLELVANTFDTTLFRWNYPFQLIDSFYVERKSATETSYSIIARLAAKDTLYNDANQPPGEYRYQVRAKNSYGISEPSNSIQIFNPITNNSLYFDAEESDLQEGTNAMGDLLINTDNKDWICFKGIELANTTYDACMVNMAVPCEYAWQEIQIRLDHPMGRLIGKFSPPSTGGWDKFKMYSFPIEEIKGTHDVYFRFKGSYGVGTMDWFTLYDSNGEVKETIPYDSVCPFPSLKNREVKMRVFPNPVYREINLTLDCQEKSTLEVEVFDTRGVVYYANTFENVMPGTVEIPLHDDSKVNNLIPGVYMVKAHITSKKVDSYSMMKFIKTNE
jgi:parallel beta-helix repeat protein